MAACDNLYGDKFEWMELRNFFLENNPKALYFMYPRPKDEDEQVRICYIAEIQGWLIENCPKQWVQERLKENFDVQAMICGKPHHKRKKIKHV